MSGRFPLFCRVFYEKAVSKPGTGKFTRRAARWDGRESKRAGFEPFYIEPFYMEERNFPVKIPFFRAVNPCCFIAAYAMDMGSREIIRKIL